MKNLKNKFILFLILIWATPCLSHHGVKYFNKETLEYFHSTKAFDFKFKGQVEFYYRQLFSIDLILEDLNLSEYENFNFLDKEVTFIGNPKFNAVKFDGTIQNFIYYRNFDEFFNKNYNLNKIPKNKITSFDKLSFKDKDYKYFLKRYGLGKKDSFFVKTKVNDYKVYQNVIPQSLVAEYNDTVIFNFDTKKYQNNFDYINIFFEEKNIFLNKRIIFDDKNLDFMSTFNYSKSKIIYMKDIFDYYNIDKDKKLKLSEFFLWSKKDYNKQIFLNNITIVPQIPLKHKNFNVLFADGKIDFYKKFYHKFKEISYISDEKSKINTIKKKIKELNIKKFKDYEENIIDINKIQNKINDLNKSEIYTVESVTISVDDKTYKKIKNELERPYVANTFGDLKYIFIFDLLILIGTIIFVFFNKFKVESIFFIASLIILFSIIFTVFISSYLIFCLLLFVVLSFWRNYRIKT